MLAFKNVYLKAYETIKMHFYIRFDVAILEVGRGLALQQVVTHLRIVETGEGD